ncbi:MAG: hypothetical protein WD844_11090 [Thermoleophilaceae bacterium]
MSRFFSAAILVTALCAAAAVPASAGRTQESIVMDDAHIVYVTPEQLDANFAELKAIGVDRVRVSVYWRLIAPASEQKQRPNFDAGNPAAYPPEHWDRYDAIVAAAQKHRLGLLFSITGPAPLWATGTPDRSDIEATYDPNADEFREFVRAVGTRYSGSYRAEVAAPPPEQECDLLGCREEQQETPPGELLGRVDHWSVWNEPNHPGWLTPQWLPDPRNPALPMLPAAARIYRGLTDAAFAGLEASGHGGDVILLGETAPRGLNDRGVTRAIRPLEFIRELYCLDRRFRPFQGEAAQVRGCPGTRDAFVAQHPVFFRGTGWAHHPYALEQRPDRGDRRRDNVVLADMDRLTRELDRIFRVHGQSRRLPIWLTEYGYQTDPPDPTIGVSWSRQAAYLNHAEYLSYSNPRIASSAQFLLFDDGPLMEFQSSDPRHWGTFQSGLKTNAGREKRSYTSYQRPIHVSPARVRRGRAVRVFGQLRSAPNGRRLSARLQYRSTRSRRYRTIKRLTVRNRRGYVLTRTRPRTSGYYRIVWRDPGTGKSLTTRRVRVGVSRPRR